MTRNSGAPASMVTVVGSTHGVTRLLVEHFKDWEVGRESAYGTLSKVVGFDVWATHPHLVRSARRIVQRDHEIVIRCVLGFGLRCLDNEERSALPAGGVRRCRSTARRVAKVAACVDVGSLDGPRRSQFDVALAQLAALSAVSSPKVLRALGNKTEGVNLKLILSAVTAE